MKTLTPRSLVGVLFAAVVGVIPSAFSATPIPDSLFPLPANVREIMNQRCVMCHGEVHAGKAEIREDLDLSTDDKIRETLSEAGRMKEVIAKNEMPQKAKLSFRLRRDPQTKDRLAAIKSDYDQKGEKEVLMAWLKDVVATDTPDNKKKKDE